MARYVCVFAGLLTLMAATTAQAGLLYSSNFNANNGGLNVLNVGGPSSPTWSYSGSGGVGNTGAWSINGLNSVSTKALYSSSFISNGGAVTLSFDHRRNFESGFDGGAVFVSINGSAFNYLAGSAFTQNGYSHLISTTFQNFLGGLNAFSGGASNSTFITSIATLGSLNAGDTIAFMFLGAWDNSVNSSGEPDWVIDNINLSDAGTAVPAPPTILLGLMGFGITGVARWRRLRKTA